MKTFVTVRAVLIDPSGKLLIIRRSPTDPSHPGTWDIPGGQVEDGENITVGLKRETSEEVGLQLKNPRLVFATSALRPQGSGTWLFFTETVPADTMVKLSHEHDAFKWIDPAELPDYTDYEILLKMHIYVSGHKLLEPAQ